MTSPASIEFVNSLLRCPYEWGAAGPDAFYCYGLVRYIQWHLFRRKLPVFEIPEEAGRFGIATAIAVHPERRKWKLSDSPVHGGLVEMSRQECAFHLGTFLDIEGGIVVHTMEDIGVSIDPPFYLTSPVYRWKLKFFERV